MAVNQKGSGASMSISSTGAFVIAFLLGAGIVLIFHAFKMRQLDDQLRDLRIETELAKREAATATGLFEEKNLQPQKQAPQK